MRRELLICTVLAAALHAGALFGVRVGTGPIALPTGDASPVEVSLVTELPHESVQAPERLPPVAEAEEEIATPPEAPAPEPPTPAEIAPFESEREPAPTLPERKEPRAIAAPNVTAMPAPRPARPGSRPSRKGAPSGAATMARPRYRSNPPPDYPPDARRRRQEGTTLLEVEVTTDGRASSVAIERSAGFSALDQAALSAVRHWTFEPGRVGGLPVSSRVQIPVRFKLSD